MKTTNIISVVLLSSQLVFVGGCSKNETVIVPPAETRTEPVVVNQINAFSFSVSADTLSFQQSYYLTFTTDTVQYDLVVTGYSHGSGVITVVDQNSIELRSDSLRGQASVISVRMRGRVPHHLTFRFDHFTGTVTVVLAWSQSFPTQHQFPLGVGSRWTYSLYDSVSHQRESVDVRIIGTRSHASGYESSVMLFQWSDPSFPAADTLFATFIDDTLHFFYFASSRDENQLLIFPLLVGNAWSSPSGNDSIVVAAQEDAIVPAGSFRGAYRIDRRYRMLDELDRYTYWIAPDVGYVKQLWIIPSLGDQQEKRILWELLSYSIVE